MNIAKFRRQAGLSQSELGKCLNVSAQAVSRWERGGVPDAALLPQIASSLGCSLDDLYGLSTIPPKNVENTLAQEIQNTPSEQRTARAVQLAWHMMKTRGSLASDNPGAPAGGGCKPVRMRTSTSRLEFRAGPYQLLLQL